MNEYGRRAFIATHRRAMKYPTKRDTNINIKEKSKCIDPRQINNAPCPTVNIN